MMFTDPNGKPYPSDYDSDWRIEKMVGRGSFGKVFESTHRKSRTSTVTKFIDKRKVKETHMRTEIDILTCTQHPFINKLVSIYETDKQLCIVLEHLRGGELFERINEKGPYKEIAARKVMRRLLASLQHLHDLNILHRDIKTENLVIETREDDTEIKLIDFGLACRGDSKRMKTRCGSPGYVAPEVLAGSTYDAKADLFSAGVIMFILLVGFPPFRGTTEKQILVKNLKNEVAFTPRDRWRGISTCATDLIARMCRRDPKERLNAEAALQHPWLRYDENDPPKLHISRLSMSDLPYDCIQAGLNAKAMKPKTSNRLSVMSQGKQVDQSVVSSRSSPRAPPSLPAHVCQGHHFRGPVAPGCAAVTIQVPQDWGKHDAVKDHNEEENLEATTPSVRITPAAENLFACPPAPPAESAKIRYRLKEGNRNDKNITDTKITFISTGTNFAEAKRHSFVQTPQPQKRDDFESPFGLAVPDDVMRMSFVSNFTDMSEMTDFSMDQSRRGSYDFEPQPSPVSGSLAYSCPGHSNPILTNSPLPVRMEKCRSPPRRVSFQCDDDELAVDSSVSDKTPKAFSLAHRPPEPSMSTSTDIPESTYEDPPETPRTTRKCFCLFSKSKKKRNKQKCPISP